MGVVRITIILLVVAYHSALFAGSAAPVPAADVEMQEMRQALRDSHGGQSISQLMVNQLEYRSNEGDDLLVGDVAYAYGTDEHKLWISAEPELDLESSRLEAAELQVLYHRPVAAFWDMQLGVRHDFRPKPRRSFAVASLSGTAPFEVELTASAYISEQGDTSLSLEAAYDWRLTRRVLLLSEAEWQVAFANDVETAIGKGITQLELGARLRFEYTPQLAPYIGINWAELLGKTANINTAAGDDRAILSFVAGVQFWF